MKKSQRVLTCIPIIFFLLAGASCKKHSSGIPAGNLNNEMNATVSLPGSADVTINAKGRFTAFSRRIEPGGDTGIIVYGSDANHSVEIYLVNVTSTGTYEIASDTVPGSRQVICTYIIGSPYTGAQCSTTGHSSETVTITSLTEAHISGSMTIATCPCGGNPPLYAEVKNVFFKGDF